MPQAKTENAPGLEILLHPPSHLSSPETTPICSADYNPIFRPGQIITGTVTLTSTSDVPIGSVDISFYGRAKVKIIQHHGESHSEHRSRANFFSVERKLFEGGYTFKPGEWAWPFELRCPKSVDLRCLTGEVAVGKGEKKGKGKFKAREGFLSTQNHELGSDAPQLEAPLGPQGLPPAMKYYHGMFGRQAWAYVEYVLAATVTEPETGSGNAGGFFGKVKGPKKRVSTKVISFVPGKAQDVISDWELTSATFRPVIKSSKLMNAAFIDSGSWSRSPSGSVSDRVDTGDVFGSFFSSKSSSREFQGQNFSSSPDDNPITTPRRSSSLFSRLSLTTSSSSSIFSRSSTPRVTLDVVATYPKIIQVAHPDPIPFSLSIAADLSTTATTVEQDQLPKILIRSFSFTVVCNTRVRAHGLIGDERDAKTVDLKLCDAFPVNEVVDLSLSTSLLGDIITTSGISSPSNPSSKEETKTSANKLALSKTTSAAKSEKSSSSVTEISRSFTNPFSTASTNLHPSEQINLGALANLSLRSAKLGHIHEPLLIPSFSTYNIHRVFGLKWSVDLEILGTGKVERVKGDVPRGGIEVVGAPDDAREAGLPGYEEAVDLEGLGGAVDDDDAETEERSDAARSTGKSGKARETADEKRMPLRERRENEVQDGEEALPKYERFEERRR